MAQAFNIVKGPVLVDDTSVHFSTLNGFPGPYMKDFFKCFTPYEMGHKFVGSNITTICRIGLSRGGDDVIIAKGVLEGKVIAPENSDHKGTEFDLFTLAEGTNRPMIEFSVEEKNKFSHRGRAMDNLFEILKQEKK